MPVEISIMEIEKSHSDRNRKVQNVQSVFGVIWLKDGSIVLGKTWGPVPEQSVLYLLLHTKPEPALVRFSSMFVDNLAKETEKSHSDQGRNVQRVLCVFDGIWVELSKECRKNSTLFLRKLCGWFTMVYTNRVNRITSSMDNTLCFANNIEFCHRIL